MKFHILEILRATYRNQIIFELCFLTVNITFSLFYSIGRCFLILRCMNDHLAKHHRTAGIGKLIQRYMQIQLLEVKKEQGTRSSGQNDVTAVTPPYIHLLAQISFYYQGCSMSFNSINMIFRKMCMKYFIKIEHSYVFKHKYYSPSKNIMN